MAYGKYRHSTFYGEKGSTWNVEIWKDGFDQPGDTSTEIRLSVEGFQICLNGQGGTRDGGVLGSEWTVNCIVKDGVDESFLYDTIESGYQEYFIRIYRGAVSNANLWWYGWVQPAFDKVENLPFPYVFQLTATDSYGFFNKQNDKTFTGEAEKTAPHKLKDIFKDTLLTEMKIFDSAANESPAPQNFYALRTSLDWRQTTDSYGSDPADLYYIAKGNVIEETKYDEETGAIILDNKPFDYKSQDVFNGLLKAFNAVGYLAEGKYNIIQPNSLKGNTTGNLRTWEYSKTTESSLIVKNTLLTIDQSNHLILGGSTLNYEPSFESVKVHHKKGLSIFNVSHQQDLQSLVYAGTLVQDLDAQLLFSFFAFHEETINTADISYPTNQILHFTYRTDAVLTIKATSGSSTRYLVQDSSGQFIWQSASGTITIKRGYNAQDGNPINQLGGFCVGQPENIALTNYVSGPCTTGFTNSNAQQHFKTEIRFQSYIPFPDITPVDVEVQLVADNDYYKYSAPNILPLTDPTPTSTSTYCAQITLQSQNNEESNASGLTYTASFTGNNSVESFDLGDVSLGQSAAGNRMYTIQQLNGSQYTSISNFQRGNPTPDDPTNVTFLLAREFFDLQTEPLEILQADIQSADISPLKLVKYAIDGDSNYKYYTFLGGTFKAQSEILSGEWYKVSTSNDTITGGTPIPDTIVTLNEKPAKEVIDTSISNERAMLDNNSYGKMSSALPSNTATTKVSLDANSKGKIYDGQKLVLTYPDKSHPLILTASGDTATSSSVVDFVAFTPNRIYPAGSILSPLLYDFTNVITGGGGSGTPGGSDTEVQFNDSGAFNGTDLLKVTGANELTIGGTNSNILFNSGADLVLGADTAGGTSSTIQYLDSGSTARVMLGAYATDVVVLSNRAADGEVQIRANTSAAGGAGELIIATFKDTSVDFLDAAELRGTNIGTIYNLEAYLTAVDFCMTSSLSVTSATSTNGGDSDYNNASVSSYATFQVPKGYEATHVEVYGSSSSSTFNVYSCSVTNATTTALTSSPSVNSNQALSTAFLGEPSKYLSIRFNAGATRRQVYGAKITLARV